MTLSPEKIADLRIKELDMVQAIVARLANYGASLKNYCITLTTAAAGVALTLQRPAAILLALLPVIICATLDAQYLRNERRFRGLFHDLRIQDWTLPPTFDISLSAAPPRSYFAALLSWSIALFYGSLSAAVVAVALLAGHIYGRFI